MRLDPNLPELFGSGKNYPRPGSPVVIIFNLLRTYQCYLGPKILSQTRVGTFDRKNRPVLGTFNLKSEQIRRL